MDRKEGQFSWMPVESRAIGLSSKQAYIVQILITERKPMTGYEIYKISKGEIALGGMYVHLDRLESKGVITSTFEHVPTDCRRLSKRYVQLTKGSLMSEQLKTAAEWCRELGYSILDADGWRYKNGATEFFEMPIPEKDFHAKLSKCTIKKGFDQALEDRLKEMRDSNLANGIS